jgi:peptide/nickel transport system substrate-binding protein
MQGFGWRPGVRGAVLLAVVSLGTTMLSSCNIGGGDSDSSSGGTAVIIGIGTDEAGFDPSIESGGIGGSVKPTILAALSQRGDPYMSSKDIEPALATSIEGSADGLTWTVKLRQGVKFQNGEPVTAEDVKFSLELFGSPEREGASQYNNFKFIQDAEIVDPETIVVHMSEPDFLFEQNSPFAWVLPEKYYNKVGSDGFEEHPIGAGPYKLDEWRHGEYIKLSAFDDYYLGKPSIDKVEFKIITDDAARAAALRAGEIDMAAPLQPDQLDTLGSTDGLKVASVSGLERVYLNIDTFKPPFDDLNVRLAINHAIDRQSIIDNILGGQAQITPTMIAPVETGYNPDLEPYSYDPDLAKDELAQAGYPNGIGDKYGTTTLACLQRYASTEDVCTAMADMLTKVGIPARPKVMDDEPFEEQFTDHTITPLAVNGDGGGGRFQGNQILNTKRVCPEGPDSTTPLTPNGTWGGYYCNPKMDQVLWAAIQKFSTDPDASVAGLQEADKIQYDDASMGFLYVEDSLYGYDENLKFTPPVRYEYDAYDLSWTKDPRTSLD